MLCYAMLCYAMLCYAMLCCAVLCCAVLCCAVLLRFQLVSHVMLKVMHGVVLPGKAKLEPFKGPTSSAGAGVNLLHVGFRWEIRVNL